MTKKISILASVSISALFFAQDVSTIRNTTEVYDSNIITGSARYSAMAGAMGALGGDISSIASNPAGLGVAITNDVNISLSINSTTSTSSLSKKSIENNIDKTSLGQIGGLLSFQTDNDSSWKFINVGINLTNEKIDSKTQSPNFPNIIYPYKVNNQTIDNLLYSNHIFERFGNRSKINIGIGGNYDNKVYVGAGVNFSSLNIEQYDEALLSFENKTFPDTKFSRQNTAFKEDANGFSLSLGVIGKINNQLRVGLSLESPTWYNIDREYYSYSKISDTNVTASVFTENRNLKTPSKLTLSGAFIPNKNFAFNIDYKVDLGKPQFSGGDTETQLNNFYNSSYQSQHEVRLGGEYRYKGFRIRGGYIFATSPFKNYSYSTENSNPGVILENGSIKNNGKIANYIVGKSQVFSGGLGYDFKSFYLDATYQHITYTYANPFLDGLYVYSSPNSGYSTYSNASIVSDVKTKKGNLIITLGWRF